MPNMNGQIIAYKGFRVHDGNLTCLNFVYEEGKTYYIPEAKLCECGFHACTYPLDVFNYYSPNGTDGDVCTNKFHKVLLEEVSTDRSNDSKIVAKKITILEEISVKEMVELSKSFPDTHCLSEDKIAHTDIAFDYLLHGSFYSGFLIKDDVTKAIPLYMNMYIFSYIKRNKTGIIFKPFDEDKGIFLRWNERAISKDGIIKSYSVWKGVPTQQALDEYNERMKKV